MGIIALGVFVVVVVFVGGCGVFFSCLHFILFYFFVTIPLSFLFAFPPLFLSISLSFFFFFPFFTFSSFPSLLPSPPLLPPFSPLSSSSSSHPSSLSSFPSSSSSSSPRPYEERIIGLVEPLYRGGSEPLSRH